MKLHGKHFRLDVKHRCQNISCASPRMQHMKKLFVKTGKLKGKGCLGTFWQ